MRLFIYFSALIVFAVSARLKWKKKKEKSKICFTHWDYTQTTVRFLWIRARMNEGFPSRRKRILGFSCEAIDRAHKAYFTEKSTAYSPQEEELVVVYEKCKLSEPKFERGFRSEVDHNLQNMPWHTWEPISVGCVNMKTKNGCRKSVCSATNKEFVLPQKALKALVNNA